MACFHPLLRVLLPETDLDTGKPLGYVVSFPESLRPGIDPHVKRAHPLDSKHFVPCGEDEGFPYMTIPCGKCWGCRLEYSRQWANRCLLELEYHDSAYFVTLTYNDYFVPRTFYSDPSTGEAQVSLSLCPRDVTLFLKRLRKAFPDDHIRYFYCGEYGPSTWRPHYHLIIFGLHLTDLVYAGTRRGNNFYKSPALERVWSHTQQYDSLTGEKCVTPLAPMGFVEVGEVNWQTCAYTARYIMKKLKGPESEYYKTFNLEPPFVRMSNRPGLARQWYEDHPNIREYEYINLKTPTGGKKFRAPQYNEKLYDASFPEESQLYKEFRQRMTLESIKAKLQKTDLTYLDYMAVEEDKLKNRLKSLQREEI